MSKKTEGLAPGKIPIGEKEPGRKKWDPKEHENDYAMLCDIILGKTEWGSGKKDHDGNNSKNSD